MSSTGANATPNGPHKVAKKVERNGKHIGKDDADDDTNKNAGLVKVAGTVAGVAVVAGIAFTVYKSFRHEDHPLVHTEEGIKQDASNAIDGTKGKSWGFRKSAESKAQDAKSDVEGTGRDIKGALADAGSSLKHKIEGAGERVMDTFEEAGGRVKGTFEKGGRELEHKTKEAKREIDSKGQEGWGGKRDRVENKGWGASRNHELENKSQDVKHGLENTGKEIEQKTKGFFGNVENKAKDAYGEAEEGGREIKSGFRDVSRDAKNLANKEKEKIQDAGSHVYEQGKEAKKRIDGKEIRIHKGDTLWGISRKYGVSVESLKASNGILAGDFISAGDTITVPY
jgi:hypothetical protein